MKLLITLFLISFAQLNLCANGFYVGAGADINLSYSGGKYLKDYFRRYHATAVKKGIVPGYNVNTLIGYTFWLKNISSLALETSLGNSMIDYSISWKADAQSGSTMGYFKQRWNKAINWSFGFKYSYNNLSLIIAPLFLFKINYTETTYARAGNGQFSGYSTKKIIDYGGGVFGEDNESKLDLYFRVDYSIKLQHCVLCPYIACQPALLYLDDYDFGPFTMTATGRINPFSAGLCVYYNIKPKRR